MSLQSVVEVLGENPIFRKVHPKRLRVVAMMGETLHYRPGERLFERGDEGDSAFVVIDGSVDVLVPVEDGEAAVARLGRGEVFGEMAVLTDAPRSTAIAAHDPLEVLRIDRGALLSLLREFPDISIELIRLLARRLAATTRDYAEARAALDRQGGGG
jgi:CRP-like cAMP-binding protein